MGCATSKHTTAADTNKARLTPPDEIATTSELSLIDSFFLDLEPPFDLALIILPALQEALSRTATKDHEAIVRYLSILSTKDDNFQSFITMAHLMIKGPQVFLINEASVSFFTQLRLHSETIFFQTITELFRLCQTNGLFLNATHIDTVVEALYKQAKLPENVLGVLERHVSEDCHSLHHTIQNLRSIHGPQIDEAADRLQLIHHRNPHALEIKVRTMHMMERLNLFSSDSDSDRFLKEILPFMIELHDFIQRGDHEPHASPELATAAKILEWLEKKLHLHDKPQIRYILDYMLSKIIVLGTTVIFCRGPQAPDHSPQTIDLAHLYYLLNDAADKTAHPVRPSDSNAQFIELMKKVMIITGVCDKTPAAFQPVVELHAKKETDVLHIIRTHHRSPEIPVLLEEFFNHYGIDDRLEKQRFLMALPPHLNMGAELNKCANASRLISFVMTCRKKLHELHLFHADFHPWFTGEFDRQGMVHVVSELFCAKLDAEIAFSRTQTHGLCFAAGILNPSTVQAVSEPLIDTTVAERDASYLELLKRFVRHLSPDAEKTRALLEELLLVAIYQAGMIYGQQLGHTRRQPKLIRVVRSPQTTDVGESSTTLASTAPPTDPRSIMSGKRRAFFAHGSTPTSLHSFAYQSDASSPAPEEYRPDSATLTAATKTSFMSGTTGTNNAAGLTVRSAADTVASSAGVGLDLDEAPRFLAKSV